jgi:hypothetical protein
VKPVVDALDLERFAEVACRVELCRCGLVREIVLDPLVVGEDVVGRLGGHVFNVALWRIAENVFTPLLYGD